MIKLHKQIEEITKEGSSSTTTETITTSTVEELKEYLDYNFHFSLYKQDVMENGLDGVDFELEDSEQEIKH